MKNRVLVVLSLLLAFFVHATAHADGEGGYDPRIGHLLWTEGKTHPKLDLDPDSSAYRWMCFVMIDPKDSRISYRRQGPEQGQAEFLKVSMRVCSKKRCTNVKRTVVFLVATDEDTDRPYIVVPGFKISDPAINENGIRAMSVVRAELQEQATVLAELSKVLALRGLANAPINFWF